MRSLQTVHAIASDRLEADAGIQWRELVQAALVHRLTAPVLTNYLGLTLGGTLAIGGVSPATYRYGAQVDNVLALQVITGEGKMVRCSDTHNRDLFEAALAGQGQCAIITRAVVRLVTAPASIREYVLPYADLRTLLQEVAPVAEDGRFDGLMARLLPAPGGAWAYSLIGTSHFTPPDTPDNTVLLAGLNYLRGSEQINDSSYLEYVDSIPHWAFEESRPDLGLYVPGSVAAAFIDELLPRLTPNRSGYSLDDPAVPLAAGTVHPTVIPPPCGRDRRLSGAVADANIRSGRRRPYAQRQPHIVRVKPVAGRHALSL